MGDLPPTSQSTGNFSSGTQAPVTEESQQPATRPYDQNEASRGLQDPDSNLYMQQPSSQGSHQLGLQGRMDSFNMANIGSALPEMQYQNYGQIPLQRYPQASTLMYQPQNMPQFGNPNTINQNLRTGHYNMPFSHQYQGFYTPDNTQLPQGNPSSINTNSQFYQGHNFIAQHPQQQMGTPYFVPGQYGPQTPVYVGNSSPVQYGFQGGLVADTRNTIQPRETDFSGGMSARIPGQPSSIASSSVQSSVVRGPPRKPRQSGHAIWIGNLPPQTELMNLVNHVCKEAPGLESLFLISKSNCAFANYKDEASCATAQTKIHNSRFQTVRLVSRLRRSSVGTPNGTVNIPTGPAALSPPAPSTPGIASSSSPDSTGKSQGVSVTEQEIGSHEKRKSTKDKFFIVKSLTVEDLELSVRNGIWATQSHNEEALNKAYQTADNVYLIFSANKSGEYFGYAKMISEINDDPENAIEFAPSAHTVEDPELPKAIPTPETEFAPKGRIIDDSARGTIFWEVEREEIDGIDEEDEEGSNRSDQDLDPATPSKAWGKPFRIEWISTNRLPFYRTRGLRNPWNSNREVKIARDGTELETSVGRRLTELFHRTPCPIAPNMQSPPVGLMGGYPAMRPY